MNIVHISKGVQKVDQRFCHLVCLLYYLQPYYNVDKVAVYYGILNVRSLSNSSGFRMVAVDFCTLWQYRDRRKPEVGTISYAYRIRFLHNAVAHYHRQNCLHTPDYFV